MEEHEFETMKEEVAAVARIKAANQSASETSDDELAAMMEEDRQNDFGLLPPKEDFSWMEEMDRDANLPSVTKDSSEKKTDVSDKKKESADEKKTPVDTNTGLKADVEQVARGVSLGLSADEISKLSKMGDLKGILDSLERMNGNQARAEEKADEKISVKLDIDPEVVDSDYMDEINEKASAAAEKVVAPLRDENKRLREENERLKGQGTQERAKAVEDQFNHLINGLGDEYSEYLGSGRPEDLNQNGIQMENRTKVLNEMVTLAKARGGAASVDELFKDAVAIVLKDKAGEIERKRISKGTKRTMINRPVKSSEELTSKQRVFSKIDEYLDKNGIRSRNDGME